MKKFNPLKILFVDILTGDRELRKDINKRVYGGGTYSESMRRAFGLRENRWFVIDASKGKFPRRISDFDGIVIGGSAEDPVEGQEKSWMKKVYKFIREAIKQEIPTLGICGGLQFTVRALGGEITFNPKGREFGSAKISLTKMGKRDPLFRGLSGDVLLQSSHKCMAKKLLPGSKLLAFSKLCPIQAIALGDKIRLVQFHPEMQRGQLRSIAIMRKSALMKEGFVNNDADFEKFLRSIENTERIGRKILRNFIRYFTMAMENPVCE